MKLPDRQRTGRAAFALASVILLWPCLAEAHLVTTGLGPVYDGIGHFVLSPEDLFPVLALALFTGLRGATPGRWTLFILPFVWLAGGVAGLLMNNLPSFPIAPISFLILGVLVATDLKLSPSAVASIAICLGLVHGTLNGVAVKQAGANGVLELIGITASLFVFVALVAAFVVSLRRPWTRIVVRVAGSWIAAIGLLMLGWALRAAR